MQRTKLLASLLLAAPAAAQQPPIRMVFDTHRDPIPNGLTLVQKQAVYASTISNANWILDTIEPYGVKLSFLSVGQFMELLVAEGPSGAGAQLLRRIYANGGQIGSHSHTEQRAGAFNWPNLLGSPTLPQVTDAWQDVTDWVDAGITTAFGGAPPEPLDQINCVRGSHLPSNEPDFHTLMPQFGFTIRQPGPEQDYFGWYGHHIWNPFRPSPANYMGEDLNAPFVAVTQGSTLGLAQVHHGVFQDNTAPFAKRQFLQLYLNWRFRDRHALPPKIWTWGWGSHPEQYTPTSVERTALVEFLPWIDLHFAHKIEPTGSPTMMWTTHREAGAAYFAWEAAHPGVSSFSFDSLAVDWDEYPYLRPVAEELKDFGWVADLSLGAGVSAFQLRKGADDAVLVWRDVGTSSVDLTGLLAASARVVGLETGVHYGYNGAPLEVRQEPLLVTEFDRCAEPVTYCASTPNSSGSAASIGFTGTTSVAANDFGLRAASCAPNVNALFFYGPGAKQVPLGDGFLCVQGPIVRLGPLALTDATGTLARALDLGQLPLPITAGSIWNFQCWYRDGAAGLSGANLTDALNVRFCP